ncbi:MAG: AraC family transcriptional regulator [Lachnospiraceae bacterium]|nr:AraC family transcriptional regulator [Lachnospiraceae bacterium]
MYSYTDYDVQQFHETNRYEDESFPLGIYVITPYKIEPSGRGYLEMHWHEELQFTLLRKGRMKMTVNGSTYTMSAGEALFINRNNLHGSTYMTDDACYVSINFPYRMLSFFTGSRMEYINVLPYINPNSQASILITPAEEWMWELLNHLWKLADLFCSRETPYREYRISLLINSCWLLMLENCPDFSGEKAGSASPRLDRFKSMHVFIEKNYMNHISVREIAQAAGISESECSRCFNEIAGSSPKQYLLEYRVSRAMELLQETDAPVTQIALDVGFGDTSYFVQYFRKRTGVTPKEYRLKGK